MYRNFFESGFLAKMDFSGRLSQNQGGMFFTVSIASIALGFFYFYFYSFQAQGCIYWISKQLSQCSGQIDMNIGILSPGPLGTQGSCDFQAYLTNMEYFYDIFGISHIFYWIYSRILEPIQSLVVFLLNFYADFTFPTLTYPPPLGEFYYILGAPQ